ncbi:MAG: FadR family transcriptional regulator [Burkholderiales bacterium]|nr:FadR family transcriptional regulator [Burkholderiales bacterium]
MPFQNIEPRRLYRQIADQIRGLIGRGEFVPGSRLPPERDLARQLGVSRPSVREALIALEVEGWVDVRIGSGIYVQAQDGAAETRRAAPADVGPLELLRARDVIESECAALAAKAAGPDDIAAMTAALDEMRREIAAGQRQPLTGDRLFHQRVAEATGNGALVAVVELLWKERTGELYQRLEEHYDSPAVLAAALVEHEAVLKCIVARDARGARTAMRRHLRLAYERLSAGWDHRQ